MSQPPSRKRTRSPGPHRAGHRALFLGAAVLLAGLAWQGHRVSHLLPRFEGAVEALGPWGPVAFVACVVLLTPLLVPDTIFAVAAGVVFGLGAGFVYYFAAVYAACLIATLLGRHWLRGRVLAALDARPSIAAMARAAREQGVRLTFWIRLVPLNAAAVSYALGAVDVPFRSVAIGTFGMFPHMFLSVYVGVAAAHVTRMAGASRETWTADGAALLLGLVACAVVVEQVSSLALRQVRAAEAETGDASATP